MSARVRRAVRDLVGGDRIGCPEGTVDYVSVRSEHATEIVLTDGRTTIMSTNAKIWIEAAR